jgi:hypothetical protein
MTVRKTTATTTPKKYISKILFKNSNFFAFLIAS